MLFKYFNILQVHAFVKREAEAPQNENYIEKYQKEIQDFSKDIGNKIQEAFNPDEIKKGFSDLIDNINKAVSKNVLEFIFESSFIGCGQFSLVRKN